MLALLLLAQVTSPDVAVKTYVRALQVAPALAVKLSHTSKGNSYKYTIDFAKPNKLRIDTEQMLTIHDGTLVHQYFKASKRYSTHPQVSSDVSTSTQSWPLLLFAPFFDEKSMHSKGAQVSGTRDWRGLKLRVFEVPVEDSRLVISAALEDGLLRQARLLGPNCEADSIEVETISVSAIDESKFHFVPPK